MFGEIFAYYLGKSAGRSQERRRRGQGPLTHQDVVRARIIFAVIVFGMTLTAIVGLVGTPPY